MIPTPPLRVEDIFKGYKKRKEYYQSANCFAKKFEEFVLHHTGTKTISNSRREGMRVSSLMFLAENRALRLLFFNPEIKQLAPT